MAPLDPAPQAGDPGVTPQDLVVLGGGEHARVVIEAADRPRLVLGIGLPDGAAARRALSHRFGSVNAWATVVHETNPARVQGRG